MPIACVYNKVEGMRVVTFEEREKLLATGEWFKHPNQVKEEPNHEEQIRRVPRKGRRNGKQPSEEV
jgi:hypothetical protein